MDEPSKGLFGPGPDAPKPQVEPAAAGSNLPPSQPVSASQPPVQAPAHPPLGPGYQKEPRRAWLVYSLVGLAILVAIAAAYWFFLRSKPSAKAPVGQQSAQGTLQQPASTPATTKISTTTKAYTSSNFNLAFSYPSDWTLTDNGGGIMTVKSPSISLKAANGQTATGIIVLTVRDKAQKLTEFNSGNATATRNSQKVAYTKPTQTQRGNTYLSFLQYASTTTTGALDGIYITGDNGYQKGQAIPLVDISKVDPVISITFTGDNGKALSITDSSWDDASFSGPLTTMFESFSIN